MIAVELDYKLDIPDDRLAFAVIMAKHEVGWLFVRHKERTTWEIPGGHRESGEPIERAAARELNEETGAHPSTLLRICNYSVDKDGLVSCGALFYAAVTTLGPLPDMEIAEVRVLPEMPEALTYPHIQPALFVAGSSFAAEYEKSLPV